MNKILSQAIRKAVSDYKPAEKISNNDKRPDLFSLNNNTELFQNSKGITIKIDRSRDNNLTDFGKATQATDTLEKTSLSKIYSQELLVITQMTTYTRKDFTTT